jgi:mono/diheme cytochrome c family protein
MKIKISCVVVLLVVSVLVACNVHKEAAYVLPDAMLPHVQVEYEKYCAKGKVLYDLNCGKCHNIKKGRKQLIPDFKPDQLAGYTLRVANAQHEASMPDSLVTEEELGIIMIFLNYKTKSNIPFVKK